MLLRHGQRYSEGTERGQGAPVPGQGGGTSPATAVTPHAVDCRRAGPQVQVRRFHQSVSTIPSLLLSILYAPITPQQVG